ncbi:MAG: hypothetical protein ACRDF9_08435 [Candidatus Limnocylindria bacterium]
MTGSDVVAFLQFIAQRVGDALPVLLGGAGGALLIWWLDGRRIAGRERRELIGALELVGLELAGNSAQADYWVRPLKEQGLTEFRLIQLRWEAWSAHQTTLARGVPRDLVGQVGVGYELARALMHNVGVAQTRGRLVDHDMALARRTRDWQQANLRELQKFMRTKLKIRFTVEPAEPADASPSADASTT